MVGSGDLDLHEREKREKKRLKLEVEVTAGCGYGWSKKRIMKAFQEALWPKLAEAGWKKIEGEGEEVGATYFVPKGVNILTSKKGRDYYNRVKALIERILERRNVEEASAADAYTACMEELEKEAGVSAKPQHKASLRNAQIARRVARSVNKEPVEDPEWKERTFPKMSSRLGRNYQVSNLPEAGSYTNSTKLAGKSKSQDQLYKKVWDPERAEAAGKSNFIHLTVPFNKKESAMIVLHSRNYQLTGFYNEVSQVPTWDGSNWTLDEKKKFSKLAFAHRKNMRIISREMGKSVRDCLTYYMGTFKQSDDYRLLKTICAQDRADMINESIGVHKQKHTDLCRVCEKGGGALICSTCEDPYHLQCTTPALKNIPDGNWDCDDCVKNRFMKFQELLSKESVFSQKISSRRVTRKRKRKEGGENSSIEADDKQPKKRNGSNQRTFDEDGSISCSSEFSVSETDCTSKCSGEMFENGNPKNNQDLYVAMRTFTNLVYDKLPAVTKP